MALIMLTFSPVVRPLTSNGLLDIKNAFLYGDLTEQVLIKQHPGYVIQGENKVCMLKKTIYGFK